MAISKNTEKVRYLPTYPFWKSSADRFLALVAAVALFPFLALIATAIRLDSPGSPIFPQERVGKNGRRFTIYKFRTMYPNNDDSEFKQYVTKAVAENAPYALNPQGAPIYKFVDDPRVTRLGALLRKTNLDELPQIFNVLKGEMSFVGPRPEIPFSIELYEEWHRKRLSVKPGITGLWQAYARGQVSFDEMVRLDIDYAERQSPFLDAKILLQTVRNVLRGDGSYRWRKEKHDS